MEKPKMDIKITGYELSLREYFAAHAPPVPDWFTGRQPRPRLPQAPKFPGNKRLRDLVWEWKMDDIGMTLEEYIVNPASDIPPAIQTVEELKAIREFDHRMELVQEAIREWEDTLEERRCSQWPWYYADMVLLESEEKEQT